MMPKNTSIVTTNLLLNLDAGNTSSYPGSGTTWTDISGNSNNGTLINGPTFNSANGGSIVFDGTNDYVESTPIQPTFFTFNVWFRANGIPSSNDLYGGVLLSFNPQIIGSNLQGFLSYSWANQNIIGIIENNTNTIATSFGSVLRNQIYCATLTYNGSIRSIYINGVLLNSNSYSTNPVHPTTGNINTQIGRWGFTGFERYFNGNIYQTLIYSRALTASEILQNFNATKTKFGL